MTDIVYLSGGPRSGLMMALPCHQNEVTFVEFAPPHTWLHDRRGPAEEICWYRKHVYFRHHEHRACLVYQGEGEGE